MPAASFVATASAVPPAARARVFREYSSRGGALGHRRDRRPTYSCFQVMVKLPASRASGAVAACTVEPVLMLSRSQVKVPIG